LTTVDKNIFLLTKIGVMKIVPEEKPVLIATMEQGSDGIETVNGKDFIITRYLGQIFYLDSNQKMQLLLDSQKENISSADIGYDRMNRIVFVPTLFSKTVVAYGLN